MWWLVGCSLSPFAYAPCTENAECRDTFGLGSVCGEEGLCTDLAVEPRCADTFPEDLFDRVEEYRDTIVLGSLFNHDPDEGDVVETQAARLAVKQANDGEGLDGRAYAIVECTYEENADFDPLTMEEATEAALEFLVDDLGVPAIVGPATSGMMEAAWYAIETGTSPPVLISPSATSPALTYIDGDTKTDEEPGLVWRTAPPDSLQGEALATDIADELDKPVQKVAVIYQLGPYGEGLANEFYNNYRTDQHEVVQFSFENDSQRDSAVSDVGDLGVQVDAVLFISSDVSDVVSFLLGAAARGDDAYLRLPIFLADASRDAELLNQTGDDPDAKALWPNIRGTAPAVPSGNVYQAFLTSYKTNYPQQTAEDSSYSAYAYDAAWIGIYGTAWAHYVEGAITGSNIAAGLRHLSDPGGDAPIEVRSDGWITVRTKFQDGSAIDILGASGELDFDPDTEETSGPIDVWVIEEVEGDWVFTTVETILP